MKRKKWSWKRARPYLLGYLLAPAGVALAAAQWMDAIHSQLEYGYALDRSGHPYNLWHLWFWIASILGGLVLVVGLIWYWALRKERNCRTPTVTEDNVSQATPRGRQRSRQRHSRR